MRLCPGLERTAGRLDWGRIGEGCWVEMPSPGLQESCLDRCWVFPVIPGGVMIAWGEAAAGCTLPSSKPISSSSESPVQHRHHPQKHSCWARNCLSLLYASTSSALQPVPMMSTATPNLPPHDRISTCCLPLRVYVLIMSSFPI